MKWDSTTSRCGAAIAVPQRNSAWKAAKEEVDPLIIGDSANARLVTIAVAMAILAATAPMPERKAPGARTERVTIVASPDTSARTARNPKRKAPDLPVVEATGPVISVAKKGISAGTVPKKVPALVEEVEAAGEVVVVVVGAEEVMVVVAVDTNILQFPI